MKRFDIWDILFWFFMLILVGYIIAKLFGWINTPEWINLIPLISVVFLIGISYQKIMNFMEIMFVRTSYLKKGFDRIENSLLGYDKMIVLFEKRKK